MAPASGPIGIHALAAAGGVARSNAEAPAAPEVQLLSRAARRHRPSPHPGMCSLLDLRLIPIRLLRKARTGCPSGASGLAGEPGQASRYGVIARRVQTSPP